MVALLLAGCVQETTYVDNKQTHTVQTFEPKNAAKNRLDLGLQYLQQGDAVQAKYNLEKALSYDPRNPMIYAAIAYFHQSVGEMSQADASYQKALGMAPNNPDILNNYGTFLCSEKHYAKAQKMFLRAVAVPGYIKVASTYENAAVCAQSAGDTPQAKDYYRRALGYEPSNPTILLGLADISLQQKDLASARGYLARYGKDNLATADSLWLWVKLEEADDHPAGVHKYGAELMRKYPQSIQAKKYIANEY